MNVTPMNEKALNPEVLASAITKDSPLMDKIFAVAFSKTGEVWEYYSFDLCRVFS
jgi:hypothetical protein